MVGDRNGVCARHDRGCYEQRFAARARGDGDRPNGAARVDGANAWQVFYKVMLPLAKPGIIALAVFTALWSWNDLLWPLVVTSDPAKEPLTVGMAQLIGLHFTDFPVLMAAALFVARILLRDQTIGQDRHRQPGDEEGNEQCRRHRDR